MYGAADRRSYGVSLEGRLGQAYNEDAFRYFLEIERKRAARAHRPVLLLLLDLPAAGPRIDSMLAAKLFSGLWRCLRETDVVGWYREERVAGAVLTQLAAGPMPEVADEVGRRVTAGLREGLPAAVARRLQIRVYQLGPRVKG